MEDYCRGVAAEWKCARGHLIKDRTEGEQVCAGVQVLATRLLRGHIRHGAQRRTGAGKVLLRADGRVADSNALRLQRHFCQPEIENLRLSTIRDEDVRGLDVAMDDAL